MVFDDDFPVDDGMSHALIVDDSEVGDGGANRTTAIFDRVEGADFCIEEIAHHAPAAIEAVRDVDRVVALGLGFFFTEIEFDVHVAAPAIDAQGDFLRIAQRERPTNGVSVVGTRILDEPNALIGGVFRFGSRHVDAVDENRVRNEGTQFFDAIGGRFITTIHGVDDIGTTFGDVNVNADAEFTGFFAGIADRVVGARKLRMETDHAFDEFALVFAHEADAFIDAAFAFGFAEVAVGGAVGQNTTSAEFFISVGQRIERSLDVVGRFVVIDDRRRTSQKRFGDVETRRGTQNIAIDGAIETPPNAFEDLREVFGGVLGRRHAKWAKCAVEVRMRANPTG